MCSTGGMSAFSLSMISGDAVPVNNNKTYNNIKLWKSIQHNNTTLLCSFLFHHWVRYNGQEMFCQITRNCEEVFSLDLFVRKGWISDFVLKLTKRDFRWNLAPLAPRSAHYWRRRWQAPHDSDHAKCNITNIWSQFKIIIIFTCFYNITFYWLVTVQAVHTVIRKQS